MTNVNVADLLFDDVVALVKASENDLQLFAKVNNDCDCVSYGTTSNRVQIDTEEITRLAGQEH